MYSYSSNSYSHAAPVPFWRDPSFSGYEMKSNPCVKYSLESDSGKFKLHPHAETPGVYLSPVYIVLM